MSDGYRACIASVDEGSVFDDAGVMAGMVIDTVDGHRLTDYIDWLWWTSEDEIRVTGIDLDGEPFALDLARELGESWGITFTSPIFDDIRLCCNACTFCFMRMLPAGMRDTLYLRDDDYRLSYLQGNFVTLTNIDENDLDRIVDYRLEPLHVSLHAVSPDARKALLGRRHQRGLDVLERILAAGLHVHAQIVLCPGVNDGEELRRTLDFAEAHDGILSVGIVPLGYTRFQDRFDRSYNDPQRAQEVIDSVRPYQERARARLGVTKYQFGDEFHYHAHPHDVARHLPPRECYDGFAQYADGIGVLRNFVDEWDALVEAHGAPSAHPTAEGCTLLVCGTAFADFLVTLLDERGWSDRIAIVGVKNRFFGGNIDVSGLLVGADIRDALADPATEGFRRVILPDLMFNADGLTLDDMTLEQISADLDVPVLAKPCTAQVFWEELS